MSRSSKDSLDSKVCPNSDLSQSSWWKGPPTCVQSGHVSGVLKMSVHDLTQEIFDRYIGLCNSEYVYEHVVVDDKLVVTTNKFPL